MTAFLTAVLTGMTAVCAYSCIRRLRRVFSHSLAAIAVEDGLYWIGIAVYIFIQIYSTSGGSLRWHFAAGVALGIFLFFVLSRLAGKLGERISKKKKSRKSIEVIPEKR